MTQPLTEEKMERLLQQLRNTNPHWQKQAIDGLGKLATKNERVAKALETIATSDPDQYIRRAASKALSIAASTGKAPIGKAKRTARNWYRWLWLSPLVTVPTLINLLDSDPGYELVCAGNWRNCDHNLEFRVTILIAILGSALWHLILLIPELSKESEFVRWHGRQALLLAGVRTVVPLAFGLGFGEEEETFWVIPVLIVVWLFGTLWGQNQAARGDCSLMRWSGRAEGLPLHVKPLDPEALVDIIRYSRDPEERHKALSELEKLEMVESL